MKQKVFLSFLMPFSPYGIESHYLWTFYKQLTSLKPHEVIFIGSASYFKDPKQLQQEGRTWEFDCTIRESFEYFVPTKEKINSYTHFELNENMFVHIITRNMFSPHAIFRDLLTNIDENLIENLSSVFSTILETYDVKGLLTWVNCPSLSVVASKYNIPMIHNELGAFRKPYYLPTAYFDFSGVNANTESEERFKIFKQNIEISSILCMDDLQSLFISSQYIQDISKLNCDPEFDFGVALQVEDDSNIIAYSNGYTSVSMIRWLTTHYRGSSFAIRQHPSGHLDYTKLGILDHSANTFEFISRCKAIVSINSSVGLEALLANKKAIFLGQNPFKFITELQQEDKMLALNFAIIAYMIPYEFLYNSTYYDWRLTRPSEKEIFKKHLDFYLSKKELGSFSIENIDLFVATYACNQYLSQRVFNLMKLELKKQHDMCISLINEKSTLQDMCNSLVNEKSTLQDMCNSLVNEKSTLQDMCNSLINEKNTLYETYMNLEKTLKEVLESNSWKITKPLRIFKGILNAK